MRAAATAPPPRRVSPALYKFFLASHILAAGVWSGVALAKLTIALSVFGGRDGASLYNTIRVLDVTFPPSALATLLTGVALSLSTKWGLFKHVWILLKIMLTFGVIVTGIAFTDSLRLQATEALLRGTPLGPLSAPWLFGVLSFAHLLMLAVASIISTYKPKGRLAELRIGGLWLTMFRNPS